MPDRYPLSWPDAFPRAKAREKGAFKTSLSAALGNVERALVAFGKDSGKQVKDVILSSNVSLGHSRPEDPGIAVWFTWEGMQVCIPVDRYQTPEANLQAIFHIIEARRTELRHGTLAIVRATMQGFIALPAPKKRHWREVLGLPDGAKDWTVIDRRYRELALAHHPDRGGDPALMAEINAAKAEAMKEVG